MFLSLFNRLPSLFFFSFFFSCFQLPLISVSLSLFELKEEMGKCLSGGISIWVVFLISNLMMCGVVSGIGANWGTQASHPLPPDSVVSLLRQNGIQKVKLFDADYDTLTTLGKSEIEVMVGIPNDMLASLASSVKAAEKWVSKNVSAHISSNNVKIR